MGVFLDAGLNFQSSFGVASNERQGKLLLFFIFFAVDNYCPGFEGQDLFPRPLAGAVTSTAKH